MIDHDETDKSSTVPIPPAFLNVYLNCYSNTDNPYQIHLQDRELIIQSHHSPEQKPAARSGRRPIRQVFEIYPTMCHC
jgi:hypothetical protein